MRYLMLLILLFPFLSAADENNDSVKVKKLGEVVVEGSLNKAIDEGISYIPTQEIKRHSINVTDMLSRMMVAGLHVDVVGNKVETAYRSAVHFFIDGVEAQEWEVRAIRPKDVLRVEYLQSPQSPQYKNYMAVINITVKKYDYGGYVLTDAMQNFIYNSGNYGAIAKIDRKKWTYQALAEAYYTSAKDICVEQNTEYAFAEGMVSRSLRSKQVEESQKYTAAFYAKYTLQNFWLSLSAGFRHSRTPHNYSDNNLEYSDDGMTEQYNGYSTYSYRSSQPYLNSYFWLGGLPRNSKLYGSASLSYNNNNSESFYNTDLQTSPILNGTKEDVWLPRVWISYSFPLYKQNYMSVSADWVSEIFRTQYFGSNESWQELTNNYLYTRIRYNHSFSDKWRASGLLEIPINSYRVNDSGYKTTPYVNGSLSVNGKVGKAHSFYANAHISQMQITPNYYNSVVRKDNEIENSKGNSDLKPQRYASSVFTYSWIPKNNFSLNLSFNWESIINDIVPYWYQQDDIMVKDMVNDGNYNILSVSVTPSLSLLNGKLNMQSMFYYAREMHTGIIDLSFNNYGISPYISYNLNNNFSVNARYNKFLKGYMRGSSNIGKFRDKLSLTAQYTTGNFNVQLTINSLLRKNGWVKNWFDSPSLYNSFYTSRPWDGRYLSLTLRYSFDFGRNINRRSDVRFEGTTKTSVL